MSSMRSSLRSLALYITHAFFYTNIFIALAPVALTLMISYTQGQSEIPVIYYLLLFFGTLTLYNVHRLMGADRVGIDSRQMRFVFVHQQKMVVLVITALSFIFSAYAGLYLINHHLWMMAVPVILSIAYVIPLLGHRLRDQPYIKIILIAFCWSWLTVVYPSTWMDCDINVLIWIFIERFLFVFAITIPFDIRDHTFDQEGGLKTMVSLFGVRGSKILAYSFILICSGISIYLYQVSVYSAVISFSWTFTYILSMVLIFFTNQNRYELYFIGLMDGLMILPLVIVTLLK